MKRIILSAMTIMLVASFFTLLSSNTTYAHSAKAASSTPICYQNNNCSGLDPYYTFGPDGRTLCSNDEHKWEATQVTDGWVYLYGSASCGTNWSLTVQYSNLFGPFLMNANVTRAGGGPNSHFDTTLYSGYEVWSPMVFSPTTPAQACGSMDNLPGGCTAWF